MAKHHLSGLASVFALSCILPSLAFAARDIAAIKSEFVVQGRVFCDTCRAGFETPMSTHVKGAKVRVECRSKATGAETCSFEGTSDHTGKYNILVQDEHEHEACEVVLVSSPEVGCQTVLQGRERGPVFLTRNNGIASNSRFANALGLLKDTPLSGCAQLLKTYELDV